MSKFTSLIAAALLVTLSTVSSNEALAQTFNVRLGSRKLILPNVKGQLRQFNQRRAARMLLAPQNGVQPKLIQPIVPIQHVYGITGRNTGWGVRVDWVQYGSMAHQQGIEQGDTIVAFEIGGQPYHASTDGLRFAFSNGLTTNLWIRDWRTGQIAFRTANFGYGVGNGPVMFAQPPVVFSTP